MNKTRRKRKMRAKNYLPSDIRECRVFQQPAAHVLSKVGKIDEFAPIQTHLSKTINTYIISCL